ncbi:MAG: hypothetical protein ABH857_01340 [Elusimicrobiota bacterium]
MKKRSKIILLVIAILIISIGVFFYRTGIIIDFVKVAASHEISKILGLPISIESVSTNVINKIYISDIKIYADYKRSEPVITSDKLVINYNIFNILRSKNITLNAIRSVELVNPKAESGCNTLNEYYKKIINNEDEKKNIQLPEIIIRNGEITLDVKNDRIVFTNLNLSFYKEYPFSRLRLNFRTNLDPKTRFNFTTDFNAQTESVRIKSWTSKKINISNYKELINYKLPVINALNGYMNFSLSIDAPAAGALNEIIKQSNIEGKLEIEEVSGGISDIINEFKAFYGTENIPELNGRVENLNAILLFKKKSLILDKLAADIGEINLEMYGRMDDITEPYFTVYYNINDVTFDKIINLGLLESSYDNNLIKPGAFKGEFIVNNEGYMMIMHDISLDAEWKKKIGYSVAGGDITLTNGKTAFNKLKINAANIGEVTLNGSVEKDYISFVASSGLIDMGSLVKTSDSAVVNELKMRGVTFAYNKEIKNITWKFDAGMEVLGLFKEKIHGGKITFGRYGNNIQGQYYNIDKKHTMQLSAALGIEDILHINACEIMLPEDSKIKIIGNLPLNASGEMSMVVSGQNVHIPTIFKMFGKSDKGIIDYLNVNSTLSGTISAPSAFAIIEMPGSGNAYNLNADLKVKAGKEYIELMDAGFSNGISMNGKYDLINKNYFFEIKADTAPFAFVADIARRIKINSINEKIFKRVDELAKARSLKGTLSITKYDGKVSGSADLEFLDKKSNSRREYIKCNLRNESLVLDSIEAVKDKIKLSMYGNINFRDNLKSVSEIDINGQIKDVDDKSGDYHGKISIKSEFDDTGDYRGKINLTDVGFKDLVFDSAGVNFVFQKKILLIDEINVNDEVSGNLKIDFNKNSALSGEIEADSNRFKELISLAGIKTVDPGALGSLSGVITIGGTLLSPIIEVSGLRFLLKDKEHNLSGTCDITYNLGTFIIDSGKLVLDSGLPLRFGGNINTTVSADDTLIMKFEIGMDYFDSQKLQSIILLPNVLTGELTGNIEIEKHKEQILINNNLTLSNGAIAGIACGGLKGQIALRRAVDSNIYLNNFEWQDNKGVLRFKEGSYISLPKDDSPSCALNMHFTNWNFFGICRGFGSARVNGTWHDRTKEFRGDIVTESLWAKKYNFFRKRVQFSFSKNIMTFFPNEDGKGLSGAINFGEKAVEFLGIKAQDKGNVIFTLDGSYYRDGRLDIKSQGSRSPAQFLSGMFHFGLMIYGDMNYSFTVAGDVTQPDINMNLDISKGAIDILSFDSAKASFDLKKDGVTIHECLITGDKRYKMDVKGNVPFPLVESEKENVLKQKMDVSINMYETNLGILKSLFGDTFTKADGGAAFNLHLGNTIYEPVMSGAVNIENGSFSLIDGIRSMKNLKLEGVLDNNILTLSTCIGQIGQGILETSGTMMFKNFKLDAFDLIFKTSLDKGVSLALDYLMIPQSTFFDKIMPSVPSKGELKGEISLFGRPEEYYLKGNVLIENTHFTYPPREPGKEKLWEEQKEVSDESSAFTDFLLGANWNLKMDAGANTWYENDMVNVVIEGRFHFFGPGSEIVTNGKVDVLRGDIQYLGKTFTVKSADFEMRSNEPYVSVNAEMPISRMEPRFTGPVEDVIILNIEKSKLSEIKPMFRSKNYPETSPESAMNLAFTGTEIEQLNSEEKQVYLRHEFLKLIDSTFTSPIIRGLLKKTGLVDVVSFRTALVQQGVGSSDTFETDSQKRATTAQLLEGSELMLGKYIHPQIFLSYSLGLEQGEENALDMRHELEASYRLKRNVYLKGMVESQKDKESDKRVSVEYQIPFGKK